MKKPHYTPEICPNCGADVPAKARACPACGSSEETGWSNQAAAADLGIPEDSFDYNEFTAREFGGKQGRHGLKWYWALVAILLLLSFLWFFF